MDGSNLILSSIEDITGSLAEAYEDIAADSAASIDAAPGAQERLAPEAMPASLVTPIVSPAVAGMGLGTILIIGAVAWMLWPGR